MAGWGGSRWGGSQWGFGDVSGILYAKLSVLPKLIASKLGIVAYAGKGKITVALNEKSLATTSMVYKHSSITPAVSIKLATTGALQIKTLSIIPLK